ATAGQDGCPAARPDLDGLLHGAPLGERVGEPGREAVAAAVCVLDRAGERRSPKRAARPDPAAESARGGDDDARRRVELARLEALARVLPAPDDHVDLLLGPPQGPELTRRRDDDPRPARGPDGRDVAADEIDGIAARKLLPRQRAVVA